MTLAIESPVMQWRNQGGLVDMRLDLLELGRRTVFTAALFDLIDRDGDGDDLVEFTARLSEICRQVRRRLRRYTCRRVRRIPLAMDGTLYQLMVWPASSVVVLGLAP